MFFIKPTSTVRKQEGRMTETQRAMLEAKIMQVNNICAIFNINFYFDKKLKFINNGILLFLTCFI